MANLLLFLTSLLSGLRAVAAHVPARDHARGAEPPPWDHIDRLFACFERLYTDWCHATRPEPCDHAHSPAAAPGRRSTPRRATKNPNRSHSGGPPRHPPRPAPDASIRAPNHLPKRPKRAKIG